MIQSYASPWLFTFKLRIPGNLVRASPESSAAVTHNTTIISVMIMTWFCTLWTDKTGFEVDRIVWILHNCRLLFGTLLLSLHLFCPKWTLTSNQKFTDNLNSKIRDKMGQSIRRKKMSTSCKLKSIFWSTLYITAPCHSSFSHTLYWRRTPLKYLI